MERVILEVCLKADVQRPAALEETLRQHVEGNGPTIFTPGMRIPYHSNLLLRQAVHSIRVDDVFLSQRVSTGAANVELCVYKLHAHDPYEEVVDESSPESMPACEITALPSDVTDGLWESLHYDSSLKRDLICYAFTSLLFADAGIDQHIISTNRVVLLHGPPGTGKTSICKALAHKLSIRMNTRYPTSQFVEINAHSLFSKWFSESGKQVMMLFKKIIEIVEDPQCLVFVLIDEVESLAAARSSAMKGNEPSDAIRVVNALLTQLDRLRRYPNVLILTTSNISDAIDVAFIDRADFRHYVGHPSLSARYSILRTSIDELSRKGLVQQSSDQSDEGIHLQLMTICHSLDGASGRFLRKVPFITFSYYLYKDLISRPQGCQSVDVSTFLSALQITVEREKRDRSQKV